MSAPSATRALQAAACFCKAPPQGRALSSLSSRRPLGPFPLAEPVPYPNNEIAGSSGSSSSTSSEHHKGLIPWQIRSSPAAASMEPILPSTAAAAVQQYSQQATEAAVPVADLRLLVEKLQAEAPAEAYNWMVSTVDRLEQEEADRAALMKRSWSDAAFEDGEEGNEATIEGYEVELSEMLKRSSNGLSDGTVLGNALDLAGAYKKNYKLDKANAILLSCTRKVEERGGAWMVKYLNHMSQVRMKQSRDAEAMEMMYEIESLATFSMTEPGGATFYETLYRNMSSGLRRMGREDEAALYFMKMVEAASLHKDRLDWMDLWDLGLLIANRAFQGQHWDEFHKAREILAEALRQQKIVEPDELILRAKVLSNLGQCFLATEEFDEAEKHYSEAYVLFDRCVGKRSPLFGMQAWACGNLRQAEGRYAEAIPLFGEALFVEVVKNGLSISEMMKLLDQILQCVNELKGQLSDVNFQPVHQALSQLCLDLEWHDLPNSLDLGILCHKMALLHVAASPHSVLESAPEWALSYSQRSRTALKDHSAVRPEAKSWLMQADAIAQVLGSGNFDNHETASS